MEQLIYFYIGQNQYNTLRLSLGDNLGFDPNKVKIVIYPLFEVIK